jgi:hypothetical protein
MLSVARPGACRTPSRNAWRCAIGSFFSALFGGSNAGLNQGIAKTSQIGDFATSLGESDLTAGSDFSKAILSGDSSKTFQVLAPLISSAKTSASQQNKTNAIFGTRSGGTAASTNATDDKVHSDITNLIGSLTGKAADSLTSSGSSLLNQGESADVNSSELSQQRFQNWQNSILGKGISGAVQYAESFAPVPGG